MKRLAWTLLATAALLQGCSTPAIKRASERSTLFENETVPLSTMASVQLTSSYPVETHPEEWGVCLEVLRRLVAALEIRKRHYTLTVLDTPMPNAFSLPSGKLYVTTGLLSLVSSDDALAGVIGHEIGHAELEHYARNDRLGPFPTHLFEQGQEHEADSYGFSLAKKAGYSPAGLQEFLRRIRELENRHDIRMGGFLSTHPDTDVRIRQVTSETKDRQPSESFKRMKEAVHRRSLEYSPLAVLPEEPPRLVTGSRELDRSISETIALLRRDSDLNKAARALDGLLARKPALNAHVLGAVHTWRARAALLQGDYSFAESELALAREAWPELKSVPILRVSLLNARGEREAAAKLWRELAGAPACLTDDDCARMVSQLALSVRVPMEERQAVLMRYLDQLRLKAARAPLSENERIGFSRALSDEIAIELNERYPERVERAIPAGLTLTGEALDWLDLEREYFEADQRIGYRERGYVISLAGDIQASTGGLQANQPSGGGLAFDFGIIHWPVEYGFRMLIHHDLVAGKATPYYREASYGGYLRYLFSNSRWRPFVQGGLYYSRLDQDVAGAPGAVSSGAAVEVAGGLSVRINSNPGWADFFLTVSGGGRGYSHPSLGAAGFVQAGLTLRLDSILGMRVAESEEERVSNPRLRPPPQVE